MGSGDMIRRRLRRWQVGAEAPVLIPWTLLQRRRRVVIRESFFSRATEGGHVVGLSWLWAACLTWSIYVRRGVARAAALHPGCRAGVSVRSRGVAHEDRSSLREEMRRSLEVHSDVDWLARSIANPWECMCKAVAIPMTYETGT